MFTFFLMSNPEPTLPINGKHNLVDTEENESEHPFYKETLDAVLTTAISLRGDIHQTAGENICSAQEKQHCDYNRCNQVPNKIKMGKKVVLKNQRRQEGKDATFSCKWFGSFTIDSLSNKKLCSLTNKDRTQIKTKYNVSVSKPYLETYKTKVRCDVISFFSAVDEQSQGTEKVELPSLTDKQIRIK